MGSAVELSHDKYVQEALEVGGGYQFSGYHRSCSRPAYFAMPCNVCSTCHTCQSAAGAQFSSQYFPPAEYYSNRISQTEETISSDRSQRLSLHTDLLPPFRPRLPSLPLSSFPVRHLVNPESAHFIASFIFFFFWLGGGGNTLRATINQVGGGRRQAFWDWQNILCTNTTNV